MADIKGTNLIAGITPFTTEDKFATHYSQFGKGGWHEVATLVERDNISEGRKSIGMAVYVVENDRCYILKSSGWIEFSGGGGGGGGDLSNYYNKTESENLVKTKIEEHNVSIIAHEELFKSIKLTWEPM